MIDKKWIGHELPASELTLDRTRLRFFAKAIGETDPVYTDVEAARAAGYADLPAPPTVLFAAELDGGVIDRMVQDLQLPLARMLHGEQSFRYHRPVCAGECVTVRSTISEIYDKKGGALEFVAKESRVLDHSGALVAEMRSLLVVRN